MNGKKTHARPFIMAFYEDLRADNSVVKAQLDHLALLHHLQFQTKNAGCFEGSGQLAQLFGMSRNKLKRKLADLEQWGLVVWLDIEDHVNHGRILFAAPPEEVSATIAADHPSTWAAQAANYYASEPSALPEEVAQVVRIFMPTEKARAAKAKEQREDQSRRRVNLNKALENTLGEKPNRHDAREQRQKQRARSGYQALQQTTATDTRKQYQTAKERSGAVVSTEAPKTPNTAREDMVRNTRQILNKFNRSVNFSSYTTEAKNAAAHLTRSYRCFDSVGYLETEGVPAEVFDTGVNIREVYALACLMLWEHITITQMPSAQMFERRPKHNGYLMDDDAREVAAYAWCTAEDVLGFPSIAAAEALKAKITAQHAQQF